MLFDVNDANCTETVPLVRTPNSGLSETDASIEVTVTKKPCALVSCPDGEIQDLYTCGCKVLDPHEGILIDYSVEGTLNQARLDNDEFFTIREWATVPG